jgi:mannosyltransferase
VTSLQLPVRRRPAVARLARDPSAAGWMDWLVIVLPAVLAAGISAIGLTARSIGFDEAATVAIASQHGAALWRAIAHDGGNMSAYYLVVHGLIAVFGDGLLVVRLPSLIATAVMAGAVAGVGRRLGGRTCGLAAGLLAAVSLPAVYWAQTARAYSVMLALLCLALHAYLVLVDAPDEPGAGRRPAIAYVVLSALAAYCSLMALLVVPIELLAVARRPVARRRMAGAVAALAVLFLPLAALALARGSGQLFWVPPPSSRVDTQVLEAITSAGLEPNFHRTPTSYALIVVTLVGLGVGLVGLVWQARRGRDVWAPALLIALFAAPVVVTFAVSVITQPIFVPRNILLTAPLAGLALVVGLRRAGLGPVALAVLVLVLLVGRALQVAPAAGVSPEPWRAVTRSVLAAARPGDCAVFYPEDARSAFAYGVQAAGAQTRAPRSILPALGWTQLRADVEAYRTLDRAQLATRSRGCRRLWLISSHEGQPDGPAQSRRHRARWRALDARLEARFGTAPIRSYGYASTIHVQLLPGR